MQALSDENITAYLLGKLPEDAQLALEREVFGDDGAYQTVLAIEDELIYRWLRGELSEEDRGRFESRYFRYPVYREKAAFARALNGALTKSQPRGHRFAWFDAWRFGFAAVAVAAAGMAGFLFVQNADLSDRASMERGRREAAERKLAAGPMRLVVAAFTLAPGLTRGDGGLRKIEVPAGAGEVMLELELPSGATAATFHASLRETGGKDLWTRDQVSAEGSASHRRVVITFLTALLRNGEYDVALDAADVAAKYHFEVIRR